MAAKASAFMGRLGKGSYLTPFSQEEGKTFPLVKKCGCRMPPAGESAWMSAL